MSLAISLQLQLVPPSGFSSNKAEPPTAAAAANVSLSLLPTPHFIRPLRCSSFSNSSIAATGNRTGRLRSIRCLSGMTVS
ncbi:hypothetical protein T459_05970 [Capsicum annuum]|uniref:Uncharacterized protein n=1 Tax=Capsicum annuum TaxID=4072 RepID=A0A2G3A9F3_CAPAN|nr:hypothetical protein T459_05970 [Capsicum annuum]